MTAIATRLRRAREAEGLTQDDVAAKLGCSRSQIARYELGDRVPSIPRLIDLCLEYGISSDSILGLAECANEDCRRTVEAKRTRSHCRSTSTGTTLTVVSRIDRDAA